MTELHGYPESMLEYFRETFEESRDHFLTLAGSLGGELRSHPVGDLSFETLYLAPESGRRKKLLILSSGIHGIEGYTGSALQRYFLTNRLFDIKDEHTGVLIIHGINPHGFKNFRRVTANNVDLNRNFDVSEDLFRTKNPGYKKLSEFLNPPSGYSRAGFLAAVFVQILRTGTENLRRAILGGQYEFPEGIFFGGKAFEPQVSLLREEILKRVEGYAEVLLVDLHTGYGRKGKLHLFGDRSPFIDQKYMGEVFRNLAVEYGQEKDFYAVTGGFTVFVAKLLHEKAKFAGIVFEFGTIDSHKITGSLESLYRMIHEKRRNDLFREMFYPASAEWRKSVATQFERTMKTLLVNWQSRASTNPHQN